MQIDMNPIHDYAVEVPAIDSSDIDIKSIIEIDEHSIDVKSEDIDEARNIDVMSINRIEVDTALTQVKIERMECDIQDISTDNIKVEQEIDFEFADVKDENLILHSESTNQIEVDPLAFVFESTSKCVPCGSRSKLARKLHAAPNASSGDKSTSSLVSQDVDQQQATSSDGKHTFLLHIFLQVYLSFFFYYYYYYYYYLYYYFATQT
jgi:hypothetical protein